MSDLHARRRDTIMAAYEAGVPIYAGTDGGGVLPHGDIAGEVLELAAYGPPGGGRPRAPRRGGPASGSGWNAGLDEGAPADFVVLRRRPARGPVHAARAGPRRAARADRRRCSLTGSDGPTSPRGCRRNHSGPSAGARCPARRAARGGTLDHLGRRGSRAGWPGRRWPATSRTPCARATDTAATARSDRRVEAFDMVSPPWGPVGPAGSGALCRAPVRTPSERVRAPRLAGPGGTRRTACAPAHVLAVLLVLVPELLEDVSQVMHGPRLLGRLRHQSRRYTGVAPSATGKTVTLVSWPTRRPAPPRRTAADRGRPGLREHHRPRDRRRRPDHAGGAEPLPRSPRDCWSGRRGPRPRTSSSRSGCVPACGGRWS